MSGTLDEGRLRRLLRHLQTPGVVPPADGLEVHVRSVRPARGFMGSESEVAVEYAVPPLPDGLARPPAPGPDEDFEEYLRYFPAELTGWTVEHVRRYRPPAPPDRDQVRRELPSREALWQVLLDHFSEVEPEPGGFRALTPWGEPVTVVVTAEQWQEMVVDREIGCRLDYGTDADEPGDGPVAVFDGVDEALGTRDDEELFLVYDGRELVPSTRADLPPCGAPQPTGSRRRSCGA